MAETASKVKYLGVTNGFLTNGSIYVLISYTDTNWVLVDDTLATNSYPKTDFIPHWEVGSLAELVTLQAYTTDSYGTKFRIVSNDLTIIRVNSENETTSELCQITYLNTYGGVARVVAILTGSYRFSITYNQDPAKVFGDLDSLVAYCKPLGYKTCILADGTLIISDSSGNSVQPNLLGISLTF